MKRKLLLLAVIFSFIPVVSAQTPDSTSVAKEKTMSIDVKDTDIQDVIRLISKGYNLSIIIDKNITGKVTLHLSDVPIMEGLKSLAQSNGLEVIKEGSVFRIRKATDEQNSVITYNNGKLTVDIQNTDVKDFLKELSNRTSVSIVPDSKAEGKITGKLYQVPLEDGLRALLEANGFQLTKRRNIYQVTSDGSSSTTAQGGGAAGFSGRRMRGPGDQGGMPPGQFGNSGGGFSSGSKASVDVQNGLVTLNVANGDLEEIVKSIGEQAEVDIVTYGSIKTEISAKFTGVPLRNALSILLDGTRFTYVYRDSMFLIGDRNTSMSLTTTELVPLRHIKANTVMEILPKEIQPMNVKVVKEQNALLFSGTSGDIAKAKDFIKQIDLPTPQVIIEAMIVEYTESVNKAFGVDYFRGDGGPSTASFPNLSTDNATYVTLNPFKPPFPIGGTLGTAIQNMPPDFYVKLKMLESQDKAKILAKPTIMTLNGSKATINVGTTTYYKIATGAAENFTTRFQPIQFGIQLNITPWISSGGQITAEIAPEVSNTTANNNNEGYPNVYTRSVSTTVQLNDGQTLILGGLIKTSESKGFGKIPFLGNLPIIGALFRSNSSGNEKTNLVIYITPHIVKFDSVHLDMNAEMEKFNKMGENPVEQKLSKALLGINPFNAAWKDSTVTPKRTIGAVEESKRPATIHASDSTAKTIPAAPETTGK